MHLRYTSLITQIVIAVNARLLMGTHFRMEASVPQSAVMMLSCHGRSEKSGVMPTGDPSLRLRRELSRMLRVHPDRSRHIITLSSLIAPFLRLLVLCDQMIGWLPPYYGIDEHFNAFPK
jgi:hypothetical protein